jgi:DNA end-binding protein Ku
MTVLAHKNEVKSAEAFKDEVEQTGLAEEEIKLTNLLIGATTLKEFDLGSYKDNYKEKLTQLIQMKVEGKEVVQVPSPEEPKIINLMEALKRSVAQAQAGTAAGKAAPKAKASAGEKKMAPSARSRGEEKKAGQKKIG